MNTSKSWENISAEFSEIPFIRRAVRAAIDHVAFTSTYGEDAILNRVADFLRADKLIQSHGLTVYQGGRHVALVINGKPDRLAFLTVE